MVSLFEFGFDTELRQDSGGFAGNAPDLHAINPVGSNLDIVNWFAIDNVDTFD